MSLVIFLHDSGVESFSCCVIGESIAMNFETEALQPRGRRGVRAKRLSLRIDMTPMVDLGFLLVAFFVMTTQMSEPHVMKLNMPKEGPAMKLPRSGAFTVLIEGPQRYFVYEGSADEALARESFRPAFESGEQGVRAMIREFQERLDQSDLPGGRETMMMIIKPGEAASYQQLVDLLDETAINVVKRYVIVPLEASDKALINAFQDNNAMN